MNFRPTSGQTSSEKNFRIFLLAQKNPLQILGGLLGGSFEHLTSSSGREDRKTHSSLLKGKKGATVKSIL